MPQRLKTWKHLLLAIGLAAHLGTSIAATLRFAGPTSPLTLDPHSTNDFTTTAIFRQFYDGLLSLTPDMKPTPGLATAWEKRDDRTWRFKLRDGVKFHDGSALTAEDVAFSVLRAKGSGMYSALFGQITAATAVDRLTVDVTTKDPDPILPQKMVRMFVMSKSWSLANNVEKVPNLGAQGSEAFSIRNVNGTGPMRLKEHQPGVKTVFQRFDGYWGKVTGNVTEATYTPIAAAPTRVAALLSGEVDLITDLPFADVERVQGSAALSVNKSAQLLWMQLEMDGSRDVALDTWDKQGKPLQANPFKDLKVRRAIALAVDAKTISERIMRGYARVVGIASIPGFGGYEADLDVRWPFDPAQARKLLAEAGYPDGFTTQLNCPGERYVNAEEVCRAVASLLGRIGIEVRVKTAPWPEFARMLVNGPSSSFHLIGVASSWDVQDAFTSIMMTRDAKAGEGFFNWALWSNPEIDKIAREIRVTFDPKRRTELYRRGLEIGKRDVHAVYLYQPYLVWASKKSITGTLRSDYTLLLQDVTIK